jgi:hypothetical protein
MRAGGGCGGLEVIGHPGAATSEDYRLLALGGYAQHGSYLH